MNRPQNLISLSHKTFKSGKLNIPVNFYVVPNKEGIRVGASFGFNAKKR